MTLRRKKLKEMASEHLDRFNSLPDNVISEILAHLPIREAVATSTLSPTWRYKWTSIPELIFDDPESTFCSQNFDKWVNFFNNVLLLHKGNITGFNISDLPDSAAPYVDRWLLFLSRKELTYLVVAFKSISSYVCHSSIFSCQSLIHLELQNCGLSSKTHFKGFKNLTTLLLEDVTASKETVEFLLNTSPLIKYVSIRLSNSNVSCLNISAPNLTSCTIHVKCEHIMFIETPKLNYINIASCVNGEPQMRCKLDRNLDKLLQLEGASISHPFIECLSVNDFLERSPITYHHLRDIWFEICFEDAKQILSAFWLFRSSPSLETIIICNVKRFYKDAPDEDLCLEEFYETLDKDEAILPSLEEFELQEFDGSENELKLIEFVLMKACLLQKMTIKWNTKAAKDIERQNKALVKLVQFLRTSSRVEITLS